MPLVQGDDPDRQSMMTHFLAMLLSFQAASPAITPVDVLPVDSKPTYRTHFSPACESWRNARAGTSDDSRLYVGVYKMWVLGYITGFNVTGPDMTGDLLGNAPQEEFYGAIDGYCTRNPTHFVVDAMRPIAAAYIRRRQGTPLTNVSPSEKKKSAKALAPATCRDWTQHRDNAILRVAYAGVVAGYVTAYNLFGPDKSGDAIGAADQAFFEKEIGKYCTQYPTSLLIGAVMPIIEHVATERAAGRIPPAGMRTHEKYTPGSPPELKSNEQLQPAAR